MPQFVYGDSYGDVGNRALAMDSARDSRYFNMLADLRRQEQQANNQDLALRQLGLSYDQLGSQQAEQAANRAQQVDFRQSDNDYRNRALSQNADLMGQQLDQGVKIAQMNLDASTGNRNRADNDKAYNELFQAISQGSIETPEELNQFANGGLSGNDLNRLNFWLKEKQNRDQRAFTAGNMAADAVNQDYQRRLAPMKSAYDKVQAQFPNAIPKDKKSKFDFSTWGHPAIEDLQSDPAVLYYNQEREKFFQDLNKSNLKSQVQYDPGGDRFINAVPLPRFLPQQPPPGGGTNSIPAGMTPPAAAPGTPNVPSGGSRDNWVPLPSSGVRVNPVLYNKLRTDAVTLFRNPADQAAYLQASIQNALRTGQAERLAPPPQAPQDMSYQGGSNDPPAYF